MVPCSRRMRGRSGPVSESKFALKTLKVSNDTLNVRKEEGLMDVEEKEKPKERKSVIGKRKGMKHMDEEITRWCSRQSEPQ